MAIPLIIGREAFPSPVEEIPGKSFNISPIEYFLFFQYHDLQIIYFLFQLSKSFVGLILEVTNTSGATKIDSSFSALTIFDKNIKLTKLKDFLSQEILLKKILINLCYIITLLKIKF